MLLRRRCPDAISLPILMPHAAAMLMPCRHFAALPPYYAITLMITLPLIAAAVRHCHAIRSLIRFRFSMLYYFRCRLHATIFAAFAAADYATIAFRQTAADC